MKLKLSSITKRHLKEALFEDAGRGDATSDLLIPDHVRGCAKVVAREKGVFCGTVVVQELIQITDSSLEAQYFVRDGWSFLKGKILFQLRGRVRSILKIERTLLNFLAHLSGIATLTRAYVDQAKNQRVAVLDTRKTTPLWRELEKQAVQAGGGKNHRKGLYDEIFVKENHKTHGDLKKLRRFRGKFVMEVRDLKELTEALPLRPRVILFDNFSPTTLKKAVRIARSVNPNILLEASGGITLRNIRRYAAAGVDQISVGALTHSVKSIDFSLFIND